MSVGSADVAVDGAAGKNGRTRFGLRRPGYLFNPWADFLCLGGASVIVLPALYLAVPADAPAVQLAAVTTAMLVVAHLVNFPHFAHSYQIFYQDYARKAFDRGGDLVLRLRYVMAGLVVPAALLAFFLVGCLSEDTRLIGYGGNLMAFLVGWHYVKQGYGMLIVDAVLKKTYFSAGEKRLLLVNAYAAWPASWMVINRAIAEDDLFGLEYYALQVPDALMTLAVIVLAASSAGALIAVAGLRRRAGRLPVNGLVAYLVTLYVWIFVGRTHPTLLLVTPAFHSLQYLVVVWRFQLNAAQARPDAGAPPDRRLPALLFRSRAAVVLARFVVVGILLGVVGFWALPIAAGLALPQLAVGPSSVSAFLFMTWIFINVHHYFLDNVMWRRENPETRKYLFA